MEDKAHTGFTLASFLSKAGHITQGDRDTTSHTGKTHNKAVLSKVAAWATSRLTLLSSTDFTTSPAATTVFAHTVNIQALPSWR